MKRFALSFIVFVAMAVTTIGTAQATEGRSQSLLYNMAFPDQSDVFIFPQLLPEYRGVYFHLPPAVSNVFGGVILGSKGSAFGIFVHRPLMTPFDQYRMTVTDGNGAAIGLLNGAPGNAVALHVPGQVFDLLYGARRWGIGVRVHGWSDVSRQEGALADPPDPNTAITVDLNGGYQISNGFNLRADIGIRNVKDTGFLLRTLVGTRYIQPGAMKMRYVLAGEFQFSVLSPKVGKASYGVALPLKAGYRVTLVEGKLYLGALAGIDFQVLKLGAADAKVGLAVPTVEIATEWYALDWLRLRTAIKGGYGFQFAGHAAKDKPKYEQMVFSSGLGFVLGPFTADAILQYNLWNNGPNFIGGGNGLFGGVSLAYNY